MIFQPITPIHPPYQHQIYHLQGRPTPQMILLPLLLKHVLTFAVVTLACFGLIYAWYFHGTMVGRHVETGVTLSAKHVYPVGGFAYEARH